MAEQLFRYQGMMLSKKQIDYMKIKNVLQEISKDSNLIEEEKEKSIINTLDEVKTEKKTNKGGRPKKNAS